MGNGVKIGVLIVVLGAAGYFGWKNSRAISGGNDFDSPKTFWSCTECKADFEMSLGEVRKTREKLGAEMMTCPKCSKNAALSAAHCEKCGRNSPFVGHGEVPKNCMHCKAVMNPGRGK